MTKKRFLLILGLTAINTYVIADQTATNPVASSTQATPAPKKKLTTAKEQNNPTVGGRQAGSEQLFGQSATVPASKRTSTTYQNMGNIKPNNPTVGGRQAGSEQLFGQSAAVPATKQNEPTHQNMSKVRPNNPTVGGRQAGSEQLFGQSATPEDDKPLSK